MPITILQISIGSNILIGDISMNIYYVYTYTAPEQTHPFYIGKGCGNRKERHLKETKENTGNYLKWCKIQSILTAGNIPIINIVFETDNETEAYEYEAKLIKKYGRKHIDENGILTNRCLDNRPPTYAAKLPRSKEYLQNMSKAKLGDKNPMYGKIPWNKGNPGYSTSKKGQKRKWITNGIESRQILKEDSIPIDWYPGRTGGGKGSRPK
jgi:hypothetical protein